MPKFKPGQSGNPKGRPPRPRTGPDALRQRLLKEAPEILDALVESAKQGDPQSAKLVLDRCIGPLKPRDEPVTLPSDITLETAPRAIVGGLAAGTLTPGQAAQIAAAIGGLARSIESLEIAKRLDAIEAKLNEQSTH